MLSTFTATCSPPRNVCPLSSILTTVSYPPVPTPAGIRKPSRPAGARCTSPQPSMPDPGCPCRLRDAATHEDPEILRLDARSALSSPIEPGAGCPHRPCCVWAGLNFHTGSWLASAKTNMALQLQQPGLHLMLLCIHIQTCVRSALGPAEPPPHLPCRVWAVLGAGQVRPGHDVVVPTALRGKWIAAAFRLSSG